MYDILSLYLEVVVALGQGYCLQCFLENFLESREKYRCINGLLVMAVYGVLRKIINFIMPSDYNSIRIVGKMVLIFVVIVLLTLLFYKGVHTIISVFLAVTFMAVNEITFFLSYMLMQIGGNLFDFWIWLMGRGYIASNTLKWLVQITATVLQISFYGIFIVLLYFSLRKIIKSFRDKDYGVQRTELYFLLVPGMVGLLICVLLRTIIITIENDVPKLLYDRYPILIMIVPVILILCLLAIFYGVKTFQDMIELNREKNSHIILEKQIGNMQGHIQEMERIYSGIRSMKHDMKNTLAVIMQLAGKEKAELQTYLLELEQNFNRLEFQFKTGNTVVDILLNMKYHEVIRTIPDIQIDAERLLFSEDIYIQSYDIGVIIGNALDNAMEACKKLKEEKTEAETFIWLSCFKRGKMLFIEVENSFNGKVVKKKQSEFPVTNKTDEKAHGIGLVNIKHTAEKYHGAVDWSVNGKVFTLSVMMKNERRIENEY